MSDPPFSPSSKSGPLQWSVDQFSREDQCQYQKGEWSQKRTQGGLVFHTSEINLLRSIIKDKEKISITDYCLLLLRSFENITSTNNLTTANACPMDENIAFYARFTLQLIMKHATMKDMPNMYPKTPHDFSIQLDGENPPNFFHFTKKETHLFYRPNKLLFFKKRKNKIKS